MITNDDRIVLNVGGIKYETNRSTLTRYPDTYLGTIFSENYKSVNQPTNGNEYFYDRNAHAFRYILEYHRTGEVLWTHSNESGSDGVNLKEMVIELDFFQIPNKLKEQQDQEDKEYDLNEIKELFKEMSITTFPSTTSSTLPDKNNLNIATNDPSLPLSKFSTTGSQHNAYPPPPPPNNFSTTSSQLNAYHHPSIFSTNGSQYDAYHPSPSSQYNANRPPHENTNKYDNEVVNLRRWTTTKEHIQILESFIIALGDVIYEIHRNLRGQVNIFFHSRLPIGNINHYLSSSIEVDLDLDNIKEIMKPFRASGVKLLEWYGNEIEEKLIRNFNEQILIKRTTQPSKAILLSITIRSQIRFNL